MVYIRTQRRQSGAENDYLRTVAISLVAGGKTVRVEDGDVGAIAALDRDVFSSSDRIEAILVFENRGKAPVTIASPGSFAALFTVRDAAGRKLPFASPEEWAVADQSQRGIAVPPGGHAGMFVALRPYYSLETPGAYDLRLNWRGEESASLKFTVR